jgi:KipI family sensor histidine kinase inhibitor
MIANPIRFFLYGSSSILIEWEPIPDPDTNLGIHAIARLLSEREDIEETVPAYASLLVIFHHVIKDAQVTIDDLKAAIKLLVAWPPHTSENKKISIPVCYDKRFALDIDVFENKGITLDALIKAHTSTFYHVYMIGFLPGFPYMATVPKELYQPRKSSPREKILRGSVGIADRLTGIYTMDSPGGWNIIGRTPLRVFNLHFDDPVFIHAGDSVHFYPITEDEFFDIENEVNQDRYDISQHILP